MFRLKGIRRALRERRARPRVLGLGCTGRRGAWIRYWGHFLPRGQASLVGHKFPTASTLFAPPPRRACRLVLLRGGSALFVAVLALTARFWPRRPNCLLRDQHRYCARRARQLRVEPSLQHRSRWPPHHFGPEFLESRRKLLLRPTEAVHILQSRRQQPLPSEQALHARAEVNLLLRSRPALAGPLRHQPGIPRPGLCLLRREKQHCQ